jgi:tRNA(adenine34) deaminase
MNDEQHMEVALEQARAAGAARDVTVGAIVVIDDAVVATGHNRRQASHDPTAHAEIEALRSASRVVGSWHIEGTLYVTQEPCPMCAGAAVWARLDRIVYGAADPKAGAVWSLYNIPQDRRLNHHIDLVEGVRAEECAALLAEFFDDLR